MLTRQTIRLANHDYRTSGPYFITVCTHARAEIFGSARAGRVALSSAGHIVHQEWCRTGELRPEVRLDEFVIMPDHFHAIVWLGDHDGTKHKTGSSPRPARSLGSLISGFKSACTLRINLERKTPRRRVWQRNYYEHVIRSEAELIRIRDYIRQNPVRLALSLGRT